MVVAGVIAGLVGMTEGAGMGEIPGVGAGEIPGVGTGEMPGLGAGVISGVGTGESPGLADTWAGRRPEGIPGAAGRTPSRLAPVPSERFAAGPPAAVPGWLELFCWANPNPVKTAAKPNITNDFLFTPVYRVQAPSAPRGNALSGHQVRSAIRRKSAKSTGLSK